MTALALDDFFIVKNIDPEGKKFERVSRLLCDSESYKMDLILDVNTQLYPVKLGEKFRLILRGTLRDDGLADENEFDRMADGTSLQNYEYVMHGKIYRIETEEGGGGEVIRMSVYASFGGLLMRIQGDASNLHGFANDKTIYLLIKKIPG